MLGTAEIMEEISHPPEHIDTTDSYVVAIQRERKEERERRRLERERAEAASQGPAPDREEVLGEQGGDAISPSRQSVELIGEISTDSLGLVRVPSIETATQSLFTGSTR